MSPKEHCGLDRIVLKITQNHAFFTLQALGKDSIATVLLAKRHGEPLDEVVYCEVMFDADVSVLVSVSEKTRALAKLYNHRKVAKIKQKILKSIDSRIFCWSCWADSNCRPHPYQPLGE